MVLNSTLQPIYESIEGGGFIRTEFQFVLCILSKCAVLSELFYSIFSSNTTKGSLRNKNPICLRIFSSNYTPISIDFYFAKSIRSLFSLKFDKSLYFSKFRFSLLINQEIEPYLLFGIYYLWSLFRSSAVLQSTEALIMSHLVSTFANFPLKIGEPAVKAKNRGEIIAN